MYAFLFVTHYPWLILALLPHISPSTNISIFQTAIRVNFLRNKSDGVTLLFMILVGSPLPKRQRPNLFTVRISLNLASVDFLPLYNSNVSHNELFNILNARHVLSWFGNFYIWFFFFQEYPYLLLYLEKYYSSFKTQLKAIFLSVKFSWFS